ncbi:MAG: CDP-alcohol phosphatidyltransferase family protein [Dehalococcoidia bacterium]|jgi:CDP-diacylglycerol--glycerol-3-phosphate 3-phosphatidyltransferase
MAGLAGARSAISNNITQPVVRLLAKTPLTPNAVSWLGFLITVGAAALIGTNHLLAAGVVVLFAGIFDMLDGALARATGKVTRFGGVLDSTLDRLSEAALLLGILVIYVRGQQVGESILVGLALTSSMTVSYLRSRIEALGIECKVGLFTRPERVIVLALGLMLSQFQYVLIIALSIITFFSLITAGQRLIHARRQTRD